MKTLSDNKDQFSPLKNQTFNATLNYAGISNAFQFRQSFDSSRAIGKSTVQVPSVGLNETFNAANGDLNRQIRDYLKKDGLADLTAFQAVVDRQSLAGVVDGNPMAATTMLQDAGYAGVRDARKSVRGERQDRSPATAGTLVNRYWAEGGVLDAGGVSGQYVDLNIASEIHLNDFIGLTFTTPLRYVKLRSADVFMGGEIVGSATHHFACQGRRRFVAGHARRPCRTSRVTRFCQRRTTALRRPSQQFQFSLNFNSLTFTLADQAGYYHGADVSIGGYDFNTRLNQVIFKNGVQVSKSFGNFFLDASASWTNFTRDVFVNGYFTPELASVSSSATTTAAASASAIPEISATDMTPTAET